MTKIDYSEPMDREERLRNNPAYSKQMVENGDGEMVERWTDMLGNVAGEEPDPDVDSRPDPIEASQWVNELVELMATMLIASTLYVVLLL